MNLVTRIALVGVAQVSAGAPEVEEVTPGVPRAEALIMDQILRFPDAQNYNFSIPPRRDGYGRERVEESGHAIWDGERYRDGVAGIHYDELTDRWVVATVGSGDYAFRAI